jgi:hypothetical protein
MTDRQRAAREYGEAMALVFDQANMSAVFHRAIDTEDQPSVQIGPYQVYVWFTGDGTLSLNVIKPDPHRKPAGPPLPAGVKVDLFIDNDFAYTRPSD